MKTLKVPSESQEGVYYTVTVVDPYAVECTCKGFRYHSRCKHLEWAEIRPLFEAAWKRCLEEAPEGAKREKRAKAMKARYAELKASKGTSHAMWEVIEKCS